MIGELSTEQRVRKILSDLEWVIENLNGAHPWEREEAAEHFTRTYRSGIHLMFLRDTAARHHDDHVRATAEAALDLYEQVPGVYKH